MNAADVVECAGSRECLLERSRALGTRVAAVGEGDVMDHATGVPAPGDGAIGRHGDIGRTESQPAGWCSDGYG